MDWCSETVEAAQWLSEPEDFVLNKIRCEQGSNLRGKIPLDFKSYALTTRPSQPVLLRTDWEAWSLRLFTSQWLCEPEDFMLIPLDFESNALTTRPSQHPKQDMKIRENGSFSFIKIISNASEQFDTERQKHMLNKKTTI